MFRILAVDDDPAAAYLLREVMKRLEREHELSFVKDGVEGLDFLNRRGLYKHARRPNLILLDVHLPRLSCLETLAAIKNTLELRVIPVIMLSTSNSPEIVRGSYEAHADCYVQKPFDLERFVKLVQALEISGWISRSWRPPVSDRPKVSKLQILKGNRSQPTPAMPTLVRRLHKNQGRRGAVR